MPFGLRRKTKSLGTSPNLGLVVNFSVGGTTRRIKTSTRPLRTGTLESECALLLSPVRMFDRVRTSDAPVLFLSLECDFPDRASDNERNIGINSETG